MLIIDLHPCLRETDRRNIQVGVEFLNAYRRIMDVTHHLYGSVVIEFEGGGSEVLETRRFPTGFRIRMQRCKTLLGHFISPWSRIFSALFQMKIERKADLEMAELFRESRTHSGRGRTVRNEADDGAHMYRRAIGAVAA